MLHALWRVIWAGQCCSVYALLSITGQMPKAGWFHSAMHACVHVGHVDDKD